MARKNAPYTPEFRRQMIELVRSGRSPESLSREFERRRRRSGTGWRKPSVTRAAGMTV